MNWKPGLVFDGISLSSKDTVSEELKNNFQEIFRSCSEAKEDGNDTQGKLNELFIETVSILIQGKMELNHIIVLLSSIDLSKTSIGASSLVSALWFWGTQTSSGAPSSTKWTRLCSLVREIHVKKMVETSILLVQLDFNLLEGANISKENQESLVRRAIKINTSAKLRQDKYNLLREESEGYSKLFTLLSNLPLPPTSPSPYTQNMLSLVGSFDLDPNRVLDVVLDVFEKQTWNVSFLELLHSFKRSNIAHILGFKFLCYFTTPTPTPTLPALTTGASATAAPTPVGQSANPPPKPAQASSAKPLLPPPPPPPPPPPVPSTSKPSSQPAQASKASSSSEAANTETVPKPHCRLPETPSSLYRLAAILIANDLCTLKELEPYLHPSPADTAIRDNLATEELHKKIQSFGVISLSKGTEKGKDGVKEKDKERDREREPSSSNSTSVIDKDKVAGVSDAAAASVVQRFPFAHGDQFSGLLAAALSLRCWSLAIDVMGMQLKAGSAGDYCRNDAVRDALLGLISWVIEPVYATISPSRFNLGNPTKTHSADPVPVMTGQCLQITCMTDLIVRLDPMLRLLGHRLSASPILFGKLCRLFSRYVKDLLGTNHILTGSDVSKQCAILQPVRSLLPATLLSALSCTANNAAVSALVWSVLSQMPFPARFAVYDDWRGPLVGKNALGLKPDDVVLAEVEALYTARGHLKRLAKENTKQIGKLLGVCTHGCPMVVYDYVLAQVEHFDNLIPFVVEALRFTTELAKDTLAYCFLLQLQKDSEKLQNKGTTYSLWFSALSKFIGSFYRRHPSTEVKGLLHHLLRKLSAADSLDLLLLKDLLGRMGGCETVTDISPQQFDGLYGGRGLRAEVMGAHARELPSKRAVKALRDELIGSGTALPMLLLIAQTKTTLLHDSERTQLKLISYLYDTCQDVLMLFMEFLLVSEAGKKGALDDILALMPPMQSLLTEIGLSVPVAFQLVRPIIRAALECGEDPSTVPSTLQPWHPFGPEMTDVIQKHFPADTWTVLSPQLMIVFWSLSLYDLSTPTSRYDQEVRRAKDRYAKLDTIVKGRTVSGTEEDKNLRKVERGEMTRLMALCKTLTDEKGVQTKHTELVRRLLLEQKAGYLAHVTSPEKLPQVAELLLQHCVFPRMVLSPADAIYCAHFFITLNEIDTPQFDIISFMDKICRTVTPLIFCSTESEASFIGYGLGELLRALNSWQSSESAFKSNLSSKSGFIVSCGIPPTTEFTFDIFSKKVCKDWHDKLRMSLSAALQSKEYIHLRSALILLSRIADQFPTRAAGGKILLSRVEFIEAEESAEAEGREDLKVMARSVMAILKRREKSWQQDEDPKHKKGVLSSTAPKPKAGQSNRPPPPPAADSSRKPSDVKVEKDVGNAGKRIQELAAPPRPPGVPPKPPGAPPPPPPPSSSNKRKAPDDTSSAGSGSSNPREKVTSNVKSEDREKEKEKERERGEGEKEKDRERDRGRERERSREADGSRDKRPRTEQSSSGNASSAPDKAKGNVHVKDEVDRDRERDRDRPRPEHDAKMHDKEAGLRSAALERRAQSNAPPPKGIAAAAAAVPAGSTREAGEGRGTRVLPPDSKELSSRIGGGVGDPRPPLPGRASSHGQGAQEDRGVVGGKRLPEDGEVPPLQTSQAVPLRRAPPRGAAANSGPGPSPTYMDNGPPPEARLVSDRDRDRGGQSGAYRSEPPSSGSGSGSGRGPQTGSAGSGLGSAGGTIKDDGRRPQPPPRSQPLPDRAKSDHLTDRDRDRGSAPPNFDGPIRRSEGRDGLSSAQLGPPQMSGKAHSQSQSQYSTGPFQGVPAQTPIRYAQNPVPVPIMARVQGQGSGGSGRDEGRGSREIRRSDAPLANTQQRLDMNGRVSRQTHNAPPAHFPPGPKDGDRTRESRLERFGNNDRNNADADSGARKKRKNL